MAGFQLFPRSERRKIFGASSPFTFGQDTQIPEVPEDYLPADAPREAGFPPLIAPTEPKMESLPDTTPHGFKQILKRALFGMIPGFNEGFEGEVQKQDMQRKERNAASMKLYSEGMDRYVAEQRERRMGEQNFALNQYRDETLRMRQEAESAKEKFNQDQLEQRRRATTEIYMQKSEFFEKMMAPVMLKEGKASEEIQDAREKFLGAGVQNPFEQRISELEKVGASLDQKIHALTPYPPNPATTPTAEKELADLYTKEGQGTITPADKIRMKALERARMQKTEATYDLNNPPPNPEDVSYWSGQVQQDAKNFGLIKNKRLQQAVGAELTNRGENIMNIGQMTRDAALFASKALGHISKIRQMVVAQGKDLGPLSSRWRNFVTGTIGKGEKEYAADRKFAPLRTELGLLNTAMGRVHGGARGGGSKIMLEHFTHMLNAKSMDADNLLSNLGVYQNWLEGYASMAPVSGSGGSVSGQSQYKLGDIVKDQQGNSWRVTGFTKDGKLETERYGGKP